MPDTGAPWNIPYVASTDLVSDWPADSLALANAIDAGLDAAGPAGIGSNVVQTVKTDTFSTTSTSPTDVTGLSATITPTSATSKILVIASLAIASSNNLDTARAFIVRDSTTIYIGDADGTAVRAAMGIANGAGTSPDNRYANPAPAVFLDSPATSSAVTYKIQMSIEGNTAYLNRNARAGNDTEDTRVPSSLTLIEVAV